MNDDSTEDGLTDEYDGMDTDRALTVVSGLTEQVADLDTIAPEADFGNLAALREAFADRKIIGLGEAAHGTRELSKVKHRFLRYLIEELGVRLVGLEANFTETLGVNRYVCRGEGDPKSALEGIYVWTWNTEEMLALLEWLREFNSCRPHNDQVQFYGFDIQYSKGVADAIVDYLERVDPTYLAKMREDLNILVDPGLQLRQADGREDRLTAGNRVISDLRTTLEARRAEHIAKSSERAWELARQHVTVLGRAIELGKAAHSGDKLINDEVIRVRDRAMAENVAWILEHESADCIAIWAHNDHINKVETAASGQCVASMGRYLGRWYGDEYYALGFEFGRGGFVSYVKGEYSDGNYKIQGCRLNDPLPNTVASLFSDLDLRVAFLDFSAAKTDPRLVNWLERKQRLHCIGAAYDPEYPEKHVKSFELAKAFDGICYVDETTQARILDHD